MRIRFTKMEGLGNDYIYVDATRYEISDPAEVSRSLSDRHFGIGADGLVLIGRPQDADFSMRMFNADGSEGLMCGNAARCIGKYVYDNGLTRSQKLSLETASGVKRLLLHLGGDGLVESVTVAMGGYDIENPCLELEAAGSVFKGAVVNVGNPHFVVFCEDAEAIDLERFGPALERHPAFPGRTNVEFVSVMPGSSGYLRMRVWERGSGITLACGTGACATAAAAVSAGIVSSPCTIVMDGGELLVSCDKDLLFMRGPARKVFDGVVDFI